MPLFENIVMHGLYLRRDCVWVVLVQTIDVTDAVSAGRL